jgi:hypothetical protein
MSQDAKSNQRRRCDAIRVPQWLPEWSDVAVDPGAYRSSPPHEFYLTSLPASDLRALAGIFRRSTEAGLPRSRDLGIQRRHDAERSAEIHEFVRSGFPWSSLSKQRRESHEYDDLKKPGWLPTAIVVNILRPEDTRRGGNVHSRDLITVEDEPSGAKVILPRDFDADGWQPAGLSPIEVIDGQHRLWAFDDPHFAKGYSLPVVAFHGLDISWQAYLFYTINIKPKRINTSLAFDLYPLLRTEDWLERFAGHSIYRETRAQEITEALWSYPESPWHNRIDMLGGGGRREVSQAAWIRSLLSTFVKAFESTRSPIGGLYGAPRGKDEPVLGWNRAQQSAFIILLWQELKAAIERSDASWIADITLEDGGLSQAGAAFAGRYSLLNSDQGVRGVLHLANDLCWLRAEDLGLADIGSENVDDGTAEGPITDAIEILRDAGTGPFVRELGEALASYDWRTSADPGLNEAGRSSKARFRGGTGYRELRSDLLKHVAGRGGPVGSTASEVAEALSL